MKISFLFILIGTLTANHVYSATYSLRSATLSFASVENQHDYRLSADDNIVLEDNQAAIGLNNQEHTLLKSVVISKMAQKNMGTENKIIQSETQISLSSKIEGMLIGSAIGDAAGGPVEFVHPPVRSFWSTTNKKISKEGIKELGSLFKLRAYPKDTEPFAQWEPYGPAGTITDDTRFKLIFFNTLKNFKGALTEQNFAQSVMDFRNELPEKYQDNFDEWIPEIAYATNWVLGKRDNAYPVERIWGGIPTMEGQMPFLPIAALNPDDPEWCYLKTYELGYFDIGIAKDINSALVAGLARALQPDGSWQNFEEAMRTVDPYNYNHILYVNRQLIKWLDLAHSLVERAEGNIASLFMLLEENLETVYWWEAWVPIVVVLACAEIVDYDPLASMQLMMEFGHDTDSYAQVMGAVMGAIHGKDVWPDEIRKTVNTRMKEQFNQNVDDWMELIKAYRQ